jgi:hypothetical protein
MVSGVLFGRISWVQKHFEAVVLGIIIISMLPVAFEIAAQMLRGGKSVESD